MANLGNVLILPTLKIHELQEQVEKKIAGRKEFTNIERSEALESLGIAQFYNGDYAESISNLEAAIAPRYIKIKAKRRVAIIKTLLGSLYYRFGDLQRAELLFATAGESCRKIHDNVLWSVTLSNLAVVQLRLENSKDAEKNAKAAVELVQKIYSKKCAEYLQAVRVLVCIYLRLEEYSKAEGLVEENEFPPKEKAIILAGIHFAQSEYSAAQTVLVRCLESEARPHLHHHESPRKPMFQKSSSSASVTEAYNPWSKWGNTAPQSGADPAKPVPLIQPTPSYMDDLNDEMLGIMIRYNMSILKTKNVFDIGISDTIEKLEKFNKTLQDRRGQVMTKAHRMQTINKAHPNGVGPLSQDDPYLKLNCDQHPHYIAFDAYMYPAVALSVMLTAQSEFDMLTAVFGSGMAIESGHISGDVTGLKISLRQIQQEFKNALMALQSSLPSAVDSRNGASTLQYMKTLHEDHFSADYSLPHTGRGSTPGTARGGSARGSARGDLTAPNTGRVSFEDSMVSSEVPPPSTQQQQPLSKLLAPVQITPAQMKDFEEIPDVLQAKHTIQQFQILTDLVHKQIGATDLAHSALTRLREEHHVFVHPNSGKLFTGKEIEAVLHPKPERTTHAAHAAHTTHTTHAKGKGKKPSTADSTALADTRPTSPAQLGDEGDEHLDEHALKLKAEAAAAAALTALATITYNASKLHGGTLHSDILPIAQPFGKDQATLWIEWALSKTGGMSFGFLGQSCMDPLPDVGFNLVLARSAPPTPAADATRDRDHKEADELLSQVRSRLLDLETVLSTPNENSKLTARGVRLEARVIVFLLLCKVTVQLDLKKEAGQCVLQLEDVCHSLRKQQCDSLDSLVYHTFAMRYRMDYEEWCISPTASDAWVLGHLVNKVLPVTKQYVALCKLTGDIFLQRDALKRLINVYSEAGGIVLSEGSDVATLPKERVAKLTPSEIETYESNMEWVQKNGSSRALVLYEEMHKLASSVST